MKDITSILELANELITASNKSIYHAIQILSDKLSIPILLTDSLFYPLYYSNNLENIDKNTQISIQKLKYYSSKNTVICEIKLKNTNKLSLMQSISYNQITYGYLFFLEENQENYNNLFDLLTFASVFLGNQLQKKQELLEEKQKYKDAFLYDLLYGNVKVKEHIIEYGKIWGWDFSATHQILIFSLIQYNPFSTDQQILQRLHDIIKIELEKTNKTIITLIKQNQLIVVFPLKYTETTKTAKNEVVQFIKNVLQIANKHLENNKIACGVGNSYSDPTELFRSFQEAKIAYDIGLLLNINIPFFSNLGLERILYKHDLQELKEYYHNILGDLENYDKIHDSDLTNTLEALAEHQFDITKTAEVLFLHRNTLRYRMKRIEDILQVKLDNFNTRLNIATAFKIKRLRNLE